MFEEKGPGSVCGVFGLVCLHGEFCLAKVEKLGLLYFGFDCFKLVWFGSVVILVWFSCHFGLVQLSFWSDLVMCRHF